MDLLLREPTRADATTLADLHVQTWREAYGHILPAGFFTPNHLQQRRDLWTDILNRPRGGWTIRVAQVGGRLVGFAATGPNGSVDEEPHRALQLYLLYVTAENYGAGVGRSLFDATLGDRPATLWVARENPRAIAFYRRNGFEFDGAERVDSETPAIHDLRMVR